MPMINPNLKPHALAGQCIRTLLPSRGQNRTGAGAPLLLALALLAPAAQAQQTVNFTSVSPMRVTVPDTTYANSASVAFTAAVNGGSNSVFLDLNGGVLPGDATASFNTNGFTATAAGILTLSSANIPEGEYLLPMNASGGAVQSFPLVLQSGRMWTGTTNLSTLWSSSSSWLGGVPPGPTDDVLFTDLGTQTNTLVSGSFFSNSVVDVSTTIGSLRFSQTNGTAQYQTLALNPGVTLALTGDKGFRMLRDAAMIGNKMTVTISGLSGTLVQTNENSPFAMLSDGNVASTLDMSGLGNLKLDVNRVGMGSYDLYPNYASVISNSWSSGNRPQRWLPTWQTAQTNFVKAVFVDPNNYTNANDRTYAFIMGHNEATATGSGKQCELWLGYSNVFNLDSMCVAGFGMAGADIYFRSNNSYAIFRNADGVSRMSVFATADAGGYSSLNAGGNTKCGGNGPGVDFSKGYVDMLVDRLYFSLDRGIVIKSGGGVSQTSGFWVSQGIIDANTAILGYQSQGAIQTNQSYCYANVTISNTATLKVNGELALGYTTGASGSPVNSQLGYGKLNIGPGGKVMANTITVGGVTKASVGNNITMSGGASLIVSNTIADSTLNGALGTLTMSGASSLTLNVDGSRGAPLVYVTNLTMSSSDNLLRIASVTNVSDYSQPIPLIQYYGAATLGFNTVLTPSPVTSAYLTNDTVDGLILIYMSTNTPKTLVWKAYQNNNWNTTDANWLDVVHNVHTTYADGDNVILDDSVSTVNVNVAGALNPGSVTLSNSVNAYVLSGSGSLGAASMNKWGTGSLENDTTSGLLIQLNQGLLLNVGAVGAVSVTAGATLNNNGTVSGAVVCGGVANNAGSIGGVVAASVTLQSGGTLTNSGTINANLTFAANSVLRNLAGGSLTINNSATVAAGASLLNSGVLNANAGSDSIASLTVSGLYQDDSGGTLAAPTVVFLARLEIAGGGMFIPGGASLGTTVIGSASVPVAISKYPGRVLFDLGSTNIFKVNTDTGAATVLDSGAMGYGPNSASRNENGGTVVIQNAGSTPFHAGQVFKVFGNNYDGTATYDAGLNTTNTYPIIRPPVPGPGLVWDLTDLIPNGNIGVAPAAPLAFHLMSLGGTNVVELSWSSDQAGWQLQQQTNAPGVGLGTNWTTVSVPWGTNDVFLTNDPTVGSAFYRLVAP